LGRCFAGDVLLPAAGWLVAVPRGLHRLLVFAEPASPTIYPLSLHDALPIYRQRIAGRRTERRQPATPGYDRACHRARDDRAVDRSEEHTSELQSRSDLVCRLLLEKKKLY